MNFFGIGTPEIFVIVLLLLLLFGPKDLPEIAKKIGGATKQMRDTLDSVNTEINDAFQTIKTIDESKMLPPVTADSKPSATQSPVNPEPPTATTATTAVAAATAVVSAESQTPPTESVIEAKSEVALASSETTALTATSESAREGNSIAASEMTESLTPVNGTEPPSPDISVGVMPESVAAAADAPPPPESAEHHT